MDATSVLHLLSSDRIPAQPATTISAAPLQLTLRDVARKFGRDARELHVA